MHRRLQVNISIQQISIPVSNTIIFFDGECLLCDKWVRFLRRAQLENSFEFAHIASDFAKPLIIEHKLENIDSVIVIQGGRAYIKSQAVLKIIALLRWQYRWLYIGVVVPRFIRDWLYDIIARNRQKWFGTSSELTCDFLVDRGDSNKDLSR